MAAERLDRGEVIAVAPSWNGTSLLPGSHFADAYRVAVPLGLTAPQAVELLFSQSPAWVSRLMALRDQLAVFFGLKRAGNGPFPVLSSYPGEVVLGLDDHHLDFRLVVAIEGRRATVTTIVRTNNFLGRAYLTAILPFHRMIAKTMMANLVQEQS